MTGEKQKTLEEKIEQVKNFRPIDDTFLKYWQMILAYVRRCCVSF